MNDTDEIVCQTVVQRRNDKTPGHQPQKIQKNAYNVSSNWMTLVEDRYNDD